MIYWNVTPHFFYYYYSLSLLFNDTVISETTVLRHHIWQIGTSIMEAAGSPGTLVAIYRTILVDCRL